MLPLLLALHLGVPQLRPPDVIQVMTPVRPAPGAPRLEPPVTASEPAPWTPSPEQRLELHGPTLGEVALGSTGAVIGQAAVVAGTLAVALPLILLNEASVRGEPDCVDCLQPSLDLSALAFLMLEVALPPIFVAGLASRASHAPHPDLGPAIAMATVAHLAAIFGTVVLLARAPHNDRPAIAYFAGAELLAMPLASSVGLQARWY